MTDDKQFKVLLNMKDILMRMGISVPLEELERDLKNIPDCDEHSISPAMYDLISRYLGKYGSDRYDSSQENADIVGADVAGADIIGADIAGSLSAIKSCLTAGCFCLGEGLANIEYSGRARKARKGEYVILIKPDRSIIVQGPSGIAPICYMRNATEIKPCDCQGKIGLIASGKDEQLSIVFDKMISFQGLFTPLPKNKAAHIPDLTEEEQQLEASLKMLRRTLAIENDITYLPAIYDNRVLSQLIRQRPASIEKLSHVRGFGSKRIEKYGQRVIETINAVRTSACP